MDKLIENVKSIKNRCEIIQILHQRYLEGGSDFSLIYTVLEDMYDVCHQLIDDYCIEKDVVV